MFWAINSGNNQVLAYETEQERNEFVQTNIGYGTNGLDARATMVQQLTRTGAYDDSYFQGMSSEQIYEVYSRSHMGND